MARKLPVTIFTGFLGAGKTTLLANLIKHKGDTRFAILVNEFGAVSIDDTILKRAANSDSIEFFNITNSLVAYAGDERFEECMMSLQSRNDIDHVLVETSGLAVPSALIEKLQLPQFRDKFILDATVLVVDTPLLLQDGVENGGDFSASKEVFNAQLGCSDVVVLNKIDQLSEQALLKAESLLRNLSLSVRFIELAYKAQIENSVVLGLRLNEPTFGGMSSRVASSSALQSQTSHRDGHDHSGLGPHQHGLMTHQHVHAHDPGWMSFVLKTDTIQYREKLRDALQAISRDEPVFRIKGNAFVQEVGGRLLFQAVKDRVVVSEPEQSHTHSHEHSPEHAHRHTHEYEGRHEHGHSHDDNFQNPSSELVFIGYQLNRERVRTIMQNHTTTIWY